MDDCVSRRRSRNTRFRVRRADHSTTSMCTYRAFNDNYLAKVALRFKWCKNRIAEIALRSSLLENLVAEVALRLTLNIFFLQNLRCALRLLTFSPSFETA